MQDVFLLILWIFDFEDPYWGSADLSQDALAFDAESRGKSALEGLGAGDVRRFQVQDPETTSAGGFDRTPGDDPRTHGSLTFKAMTF